MLTRLFRKVLICHLKKIHSSLKEDFFSTMGHEVLRPVHVDRRRRSDSLGNKRLSR